MTEQGTKGTGSGGFESEWGARCEGRGSVLFPGWNCKNAFLSGPQCQQNGLFHLIEWPLCIRTNRSIWWLGSFIICWRKFSVTRSDDLFLWPICWNMKKKLLFGTLIFPFHYSITSITHSNGRLDTHLQGMLWPGFQPQKGEGQSLRSLIVYNFNFMGILNYYTLTQYNSVFKNLQKKAVIRMLWKSMWSFSEQLI